MSTLNTPEKKKRNADGCQPCKTARVKCDRGKPCCGGCIKRGDDCTYNRIQFNTINSTKHDRRTGRKAKLKPGVPAPSPILGGPILQDKRSIKKESMRDKAIAQVPLISLSAQQIIPYTGPGKQRSSPAIPAPTTSSSHWQAPSSMPSMMPIRAYPSAFAPPMPLSACPSMRDWPSTDSWKSPSTAPSTLPDQFDQGARRRESITLADVLVSETETADEIIELGRPQPKLHARKRARASSGADLAHRSRNGFSTAMHSLAVEITSLPLAPGIAELLRVPGYKLIFEHYVHQTCSFLHPAEGDDGNRNPSLRHFLPVALSDPDVLKGTLALSATQLASVDEPQPYPNASAVAEQALLLRSQSIKAMHRLVHDQSRAAKAAKNSPRISNIGGSPDSTSSSMASLYDAYVNANSYEGALQPGVVAPALHKLLTGLLSQISLAVVDHGEHWQSHLSVARILLKQLPPYDQSSNIERYLRARVLKYICFAEIALPTTEELDLRDVEGHEFDVPFATPSQGLKLAVLISRHVHDIEVGFSPPEALTLQREQIEIGLVKYIHSGDPFDAVADLTAGYRSSIDGAGDTSDDWRLVERIWKATILLLYDRALHGSPRTARPLRASDRDAQLRACAILQMVHLVPHGSPYATALALPLHIVAPLVSRESILVLTSAIGASSPRAQPGNGASSSDWRPGTQHASSDSGINLGPSPAFSHMSREHIDKIRNDLNSDNVQERHRRNSFCVGASPRPTEPKHVYARSWLLSKLDSLARQTRTRNFVRVGEFAQLCWQIQDIAHATHDSLAVVTGSSGPYYRAHPPTNLESRFTPRHAAADDVTMAVTAAARAVAAAKAGHDIGPMQKKYNRLGRRLDQTASSSRLDVLGLDGDSRSTHRAIVSARGRHHYLPLEDSPMHTIDNSTLYDSALDFSPMTTAVASSIMHTSSRDSVMALHDMSDVWRDRPSATNRLHAAARDQTVTMDEAMHPTANDPHSAHHRSDGIGAAMEGDAFGCETMQQWRELASRHGFVILAA